MNFIKFIRIFLLALIFIGLGLLVTQRFWLPKVVDRILKSENQQIMIASVQSKSSKITNLKTYINKKIGISFKYPDGFKIHENSKNSENQITINVSLKDFDETINSEAVNSNDINIFFNHENFTSALSDATPYSFHKKSDDEWISDLDSDTNIPSNKEGWILDGRQGSSDKVMKITGKNLHGLEGKTTYEIENSDDTYGGTNNIFEVVLTNTDDNKSILIDMPEGSISKDVFDMVVSSLEFLK